MRNSGIWGIVLVTVGVFISVFVFQKNQSPDSEAKVNQPSHTALWVAPDTATLPTSPEGDLIRYGRKLISNTSEFLGPNGKIASISNGMNCQNCHLDAGVRPFGNSLCGVASTYPMKRNRSGIIESIEFRINDCMLRSLNGSPLDSNSLEMQAMVAYIKWIGKDVPAGMRPENSGTPELEYLDRAADPVKGELVYTEKCSTCHGSTGEGVLHPSGNTYVYPPLWGPKSYNSGAGLFRLSRFASYVKYNMPFGASYIYPELSDEEAWDVAAYVNSQPRPEKNFAGDWPDVNRKAIDHPSGPYADPFSETQHRYGPFGPIEKFRDSLLVKRKSGK